MTPQERELLPCPLWRKTERDAGNELIDRIDKMSDDLKAAQSTQRERVIEVCQLEYVSADETDGVLGEDDLSYNRGTDDCIAAIRALKDKP